MVPRCIQLLGQYQYIYAALEEAATHCAAEPVFAPLYDERLARSAALGHDLAALGAPNPPSLPATVRYTSRLRSLPGAEELIAHHYTRYLGDLSGGQAIGRLVGRHYGIPRSALTMWDFTPLGRIKPYKDHYREQLDMLAGRVDTERVAAEAITAFEFSRRLFVEVKSSLAN